MAACRTGWVGCAEHTDNGVSGGGPEEGKAKPHLRQASGALSMSGSNYLSQVRPADVLRDAIDFHLRYTFVRDGDPELPSEILPALSLAIRDQLVDRMLE